MKTVGVLVLGGALLLNAPCSASSNPSVDNAFRLCTGLDATGSLTQECEVSGWNSTVSIKTDLKPDEAREFCSGIVGIAKKKGWTFEPKWQLRIYSPYSGENTIAVCKL